MLNFKCAAKLEPPEKRILRLGSVFSSPRGIKWVLRKFLFEYVFRRVFGVCSCKTKLLPFYQATVFQFGTCPEFKGSYTGGMSWWLHRKELETDISRFLFRIILCRLQARLYSNHFLPQEFEFYCNFLWCAVCYHKQSSYFKLILWKYPFYRHFSYRNQKN